MVDTDHYIMKGSEKENMNHLFKRTLSLIVAVVMVLAMIPANPVHVRADSTTAIDGFLMNLQGKTGATATSEKIGNEWTYYDSLADMSLYVQNTSANAYKWQVEATPYKINADGSANKLVDPVMLHQGNVQANMTSAIDLLAGKLSQFNSLITSKGNGRYGLVVTIKDSKGNQVLEQPYYFNYTNQSVFVDLVKTDGSEGLVLGPDEKCDLTLMIKNKGGNKTVSAKYVGTKGTQSATYDITTNYALAQGKELSISLNTSALGHCTAEGEYSIEVTITDAKGTVGANTFTVTREAAPATEVTVATLDELLEALADDSNDLPIVVTETIVIDKALTIDGNGATVKFDSAASAFVIKSSDVTIRDMTIVQGTKDNSFHISVDKGAWDAPAIQYSNIAIENIVFQGGDYALCLIGENVVVDGCTFTEQDSHNILVYSLKGDSKIINNTFNASKGNNKSAILYEGGVSTTLTGDDLAAFMGGGNLTISGNEAYNKGVFFQFTNWGLVEGMEVEISDNLVDGTTNKVIALYTETPSVASGEEFASFVVSENAFINTAAGRTIIKEYTGKIAVDMTGNYLGSATPDLGALLVGNLVSCDAYYATYENGVLGEYVSTKPAVAEVNGEEFGSFAEAITYANEQTGTVTVTLLADVEFEGDDLYADMILDLNGKTITATGPYVFWFEGGSLTIQDSSAEKTGMIDGSETVGNAFLLMGEESLTIESGKIHANNNVIYAYGSGATVTINGGELKSYIGTGNLFYLVGANDTITVNGGTFLGNVTPYAAGLIIKGGVFTADVNAYCAANHGAVLNGDGLYEIVPLSNETAVAQIGDKYYLTLGAAINAAGANDTILVLKDVTEELPTLKGKIVPANGSVTITATNTDWIYLPNAFEIGEGVTLNIPYGGMFVYYNEQAVIKGHVVTDAVYLAYPGTKLTVCEPGSLTVTGESFIIRGMEGDVDSGLYIVGDNNDATIGLKADVIYFYQGTVSAKDANIQVSVFWQTQETDGVGSANLILDNTKMNVTVGEQIFKATGNSTVTLTNGSQVSAAGGYDGVNVYMDDTSVFVHNSNAVFAAKANNVAYKTVAEAVEAAANGATITLLVDSDEDIALAKAIELKLNGKSYTGTITLAEGATLTAPEDLDVITDVADYQIVYKDGAYSVNTHTCVYTSTITTAPTTTTEGLKTFTCVCGESYTEIMAVLPQAIVTDKGATTYVGSYYTFDVNTGKINSAEGGINLPKTLVFTAQEEGEAAENNYYASYNTDFYVKLEGLSAETVRGTGCYLAGYYEAYELWVVIPLDAVDIQNGLAYPLLAIAGQDFSYEMICNGVKEFTCGLYLSDEFLAANPNVQVTVDLGLREEQIKDLGELENLEYFQSEGFEYEKDDLDAELVAMVGSIKYYSLEEAFAAAETGAIVTLLANSDEDIALAKAVELNVNGKSYTGTITLAEGAALTAPEGLDVTTNVADHKVFYKDGAYVAYEKVELPQVAITDVKGNLLDSDPDLTFALNFAIANMDELTDEYLEKLFAFYGDYYTDYVLTISGLNQDSVTFNANGDADGYLAGQYDAWSENWVSVPFEDVTVRNGESLYIMEYAAKLMGQSGLRFTLAEVAAIVQNFDCGVYFTPEFLAANPGLQVTLELKVFTEDAEGNKIEDISVATNNFDVENVAAIVVGEDKQTRYFDSFTAAVAAAEAGDTVIMLEDATLSGKLTMSKNITIDGNGHSIIANHTSYILETSADCTFKDITLNTNGKAKGVKIASGNVVFDNVAIPNSNKSDAITVAGTLTLKNYFKVASSYTMIDARSGVVIAEPGTVFDMTTWRANVSPAKSDLTGAVKTDGEPFFVAYGSTTYYTSLSSIATTITDLTLLDDVDLPAKTLTVKGNLNLNGHDLVVKELKVAGATTITGGAVTAEKLTLTSSSATLTAPEGLNVTTTLEGYQVVCKDGVYTLIKAVASVGGVFYETFEEAWAAVQAGGTIKLLVDYNPNMITVFENVTLDLNGHTASAAYVVVFNGGHIVDNSESNAGRLVAGNLMINEKNKQLPVKTDNGYMFVEVIKCNTAVQMDGAKFVFQPWIELTAHDQIKKGAEASGVSVVVRVTYYVGTDKRVQDFIYSDEMVTALLNSWNGVKYASMLSLKLNGLENYSNISYECVLVSETGVELSYRPAQ